jgi:hypothetical protein
MRIGSISALALAAFALAACEGTPTTGSSASVADLSLCGLGCPFGNPNSGTNVTNDTSDNDDSSTDGGNDTSLDPLTADTTIALESSRLVKPSGSIPSLSKLTSGITTTTTTAQILSGTKPTKLTIAVDTNSGTNAAWPTPAEMDLYLYGTNAADPTGGNNGGTNCLPDCGYREYHVYSTETGKERDESLQVWAWGDSYATQYRVTPNGGEAKQQAWSFGGNKTALVDMPTSGSATYNGRFVATAKTANYLKPSGALIDPNALWRVQGASQVTANFGASGTVAGTLTPETWTSFQTGISGDYMKTVGVTPTPPYSAIETPNYSFYNTTVSLNGTITGNTYAGTTPGSATLGGAFISGDETMYGGFFGATGAETTGVFHVTGMDPYPVGGSAGINDDKRAYLTIQGAFNGTTP